MKRSSVAVIGAGAIGTAIAGLLRRRGFRAALWDVKTKRIRGPRVLANAVFGARAVFVCVSADAVRTAARAIAPHIPARVPVVSVAKGLESRTGRTVDAVLAETLPENPAVLLSGPMLAQELSRTWPGFAVAASRNRTAARTVAGLFRGTALTVEISTDVRGVALAGMLKNVYAVGLGIAEGLRWDSNARGWLVGRSLNELAALLVRFGGRRTTALGTSGLGDLIATGFSPASRNRTVGHTLAYAPKRAGASEGTRAIPIVRRWLGSRAVRYPVLAALGRVVQRREPAARAFGKLLGA